MKVVRKKNKVIFNTLAKMKDSSVAVGFFPEAQYEDGTQVAAVAYKNEFGEKNAGVPMRSFFRTTIHEKENEWAIKTAALISKGSESIDVMSAMGAVIAADIQQKIISIMTPPNSQYTIDMKGFNNPLIDTGLMLKSVTFKTKAVS